MLGEINIPAQTVITPLTSKGSKSLRTVTGSLQSCSIHIQQIWILVTHGWPIRTDCTPLPNPPNRLSLNPPTLSASYGHTWSLLTKLHPLSSWQATRLSRMLQADKQTPFDCCWLYPYKQHFSSWLHITQKDWGKKTTKTQKHNTPIKDRAIDRWTTWRSK